MSWKKTRLKFLSEVPITNGLGEAGAYDNPDWPRYIRTTDIGDARTLKSDTFKSLPPDVARKAQLAPGDLLMTAAGATIGKSHLFNLDIHACYAGYLVRFRPGKDVDARYVAYWAESKLYWSQVHLGAVRSTIDNFSAGKYRNLELEVPPLEEQRRIADFLDAETARIDKLSDASSRQIGILDERLTAVLRALTTGAHQNTTATGVQWMPRMRDGWTLFKVGREFITGSGTTPRSSEHQYFGEGHYWLNTGDLRDGVVFSPAKTLTTQALTDYSALKLHPPGSLVVALYGATTGRVGILGVEACVNQACCVLNETGTGALTSSYAFYWFLAHRREILDLASGGGQPNISQELVRSLRIPAPSREEQGVLVNEATRVENAIRKHQAKIRSRIELLAERRQALITAAVTGEFDVSAASGRGIEE